MRPELLCPKTVRFVSSSWHSSINHPLSTISHSIPARYTHMHKHIHAHDLFPTLFCLFHIICTLHVSNAHLNMNTWRTYCHVCFHSLNKKQYLCPKGDASSDYSPNKLPRPLNKSVSPPLSHRAVVQQRSMPSTSKLAKYQVPRYSEEMILRQQSHKPSLQRSSISYTDHLMGDRKNENNIRGEYTDELRLMEKNTNLHYWFSQKEKPHLRHIRHHLYHWRTVLSTLGTPKAKRSFIATIQTIAVNQVVVYHRHHNHYIYIKVCWLWEAHSPIRKSMAQITSTFIFISRCNNFSRDCNILQRGRENDSAAATGRRVVSKWSEQLCSNKSKQATNMNFTITSIGCTGLNREQ